MSVDTAGTRRSSPAAGDATWRESGTRGASRRLAGSIGASAVLHVLVIAALALRAGHHGPPAPPVYRVDLVAAPPGPRAIGTVAPEPPPAAEAPTPAPAPAPTPAPTPPRPETRPREMPAPTPPKAAPKPPPRMATPVPPTPAKPATPAAKPPAKPPAKAPTKPPPTPAKATPSKAGEVGGKPGATGPTGPRAGGGPEGGRGADVANVHIAGLEFPYSGYLTNIVRQVALRFTPPNRASVLQADVAFLIHRDGSVSDVRVVKGSGSYAFDLEARGAVEAAGEAKAFGPLPAGFTADVLPVTFSFDPRVIR